MAFRSGMIALMLVSTAGLALAQSPPTGTGRTDETVRPSPGAPSSGAALQLTVEQRTTILNAIRHDSRAPSPINFVVSVGAPVPPSIELYMLPDTALATTPEAKLVKYTVVQDQVVLVDPTTMRVVDVLRQ